MSRHRWPNDTITFKKASIAKSYSAPCNGKVFQCVSLLRLRKCASDVQRDRLTDTQTDRQTNRQTHKPRHTQTDTQTKYCNPRCTCTPRVNVFWDVLPYKVTIASKCRKWSTCSYATATTSPCSVSVHLLHVVVTHWLHQNGHFEMLSAVESICPIQILTV